MELTHTTRYVKHKTGDVIYHEWKHIRMIVDLREGGIIAIERDGVVRAKRSTHDCTIADLTRMIMECEKMDEQLSRIG